MFELKREKLAKSTLAVATFLYLLARSSAENIELPENSLSNEKKLELVPNIPPLASESQLSEVQEGISLQKSDVSLVSNNLSDYSTKIFPESASTEVPNAETITGRKPKTTNSDNFFENQEQDENEGRQYKFNFYQQNFLNELIIPFHLQNVCSI